MAKKKVSAVRTTSTSTPAPSVPAPTQPRVLDNVAHTLIARALMDLVLPDDEGAARAAVAVIVAEAERKSRLVARALEL